MSTPDPAEALADKARRLVEDHDYKEMISEAIRGKTVPDDKFYAPWSSLSMDFELLGEALAAYDAAAPVREAERAILNWVEEMDQERHKKGHLPDWRETAQIYQHEIITSIGLLQEAREAARAAAAEVSP